MATELDRIMALVDDYADAFHACMRPDGGIQFADGLVAKTKKDTLRRALCKAIALNDLEGDILEFLEDHSDVRDGPDGEYAPNRAMSLITQIKMAKGELP
jgi:hypothetical protein